MGAKPGIQSVISKLQYPGGMRNDYCIYHNRRPGSKVYYCWALHRDIDKFKSMIEESLIRDNANYELNVRASSIYYDKQFLYNIEITVYQSPVKSTKPIDGECSQSI